MVIKFFVEREQGLLTCIDYLHDTVPPCGQSCHCLIKEDECRLWEVELVLMNFPFWKPPPQVYHYDTWSARLCCVIPGYFSKSSGSADKKRPISISIQHWHPKYLRILRQIVKKTGWMRPMSSRPDTWSWWRPSGRVAGVIAEDVSNNSQMIRCVRMYQ